MPLSPRGVRDERAAHSVCIGARRERELGTLPHKSPSRCKWKGQERSPDAGSQVSDARRRLPAGQHSPATIERR